MIQFYQPEIEENLSLGPEDSAHCARVLRGKPGDIIYVVDGKGSRYECEITQCTAKRVDIEIKDREEHPKRWKGRLELCVAPTKNMDRIEWLIEKATEIGFDRFTPVECQRSERRTIKRERLEKIAVSAMKQSLKSTLPEIREMRSFKEILDEPFEGETVMGYCSDETERREFAKIIKPGQNVRILIGPEGDFSPDEVRRAIERGVKAVTFGQERLRTETAALAALHTAHVVGQMNANE